MNRKFFFATRARKVTTITITTLLSLFLLYVLVGFLVIAPVAKWQLEEQLPPVLQRNVTIGNISVNPLTLRVEFTDIAVVKKDGDGNLFSIGMFEAQLSGKSIFALAPIVEHVRIVKPNFNVTRYKDDTLSIDDILKHLAKQAEESVAEPKEKEKDKRIFPFKVLNLIMEDGHIVFNDEKEDTVQTISELSLAIPLASSFESDLHEAVKPKLSMLINGTPFDLDGSTYPFSNNLLTKFSFSTDKIPLSRYWRYVPVDSPVALTSGDMQISINLGFSRPEGEPLELHVDGKVELTDLGLTKKDKSEVLKVPQLVVNLKDFSLAEKKVIFQNIEIDSPYVEVHRQKDNLINWATYFKPEKDDSAKSASQNESKNAAANSTESTKPIGSNDEVKKAATPNESTAKHVEEEQPFIVIVESFTIKKGKVLFQDSTVPGPFAITLSPVDVTVKNITTEPNNAAEVAITIGDNKMIEVVGGVAVSPVAADLKASIKGLGLAQFMPYIASATPAKIGSGALSAAANIQVSSGDSSQVLVKVANGNIQLQNLAVTGKDFKKAPIFLQTLVVDGANVDLQQQSVSIGNISFITPDITITRSKNGIDLISLLVAEQKGSGLKESEPAPKAKKAASGGSAWKLRIQGVAVKNGKITLHDTALQKTVITSLKDVAITASDISLDNKPAAFSVSTGVNDKSKINAKGTFAHSPLAVDADVNIKDINIPDFAEYINEHTDVTITKGTVSATAKGKVAVPETGDPKITVTGDVTVNNVSADNKVENERLGSVKQVAVKKATFDSAKNSATIESVTIDKPQTEVILRRDGSVSLARAAGKSKGKQTPKVKQPTKTSPRGKGSAIQASTQPFSLSIGAIKVRNGAVTFQDTSVTPKVILDVENIAASYKQFSLAGKKPSPVSVSATLKGRSIKASGMVNPMVSPIALNMTLKLDDVGLDAFSPYTVKYIAYPVKSGSLNADVKLKIQQNKLNADNNLLFEDFTLGERNAQSKAPSVPIKLGLSLMRQPNGDIPINLPVTGNLNDPNFHLSQIIATTLVNIVVKAAISPFTLLGSLIGDLSPDEAQYVVFKPGSAVLPKSDAQKLAKIASVLKTKPSITMECLGYYNPEIDVKGLRDRAVTMAVKQEWYNSLSSATKKNINLEDAPVPKYNYDEYLEAAYENAPELKEHPRPGGFLGYKDQTREQMEEYLRKTADTSHEALRKLALDRANAVREVIIKNSPQLEGRVTAVQAGSSKQDKHATSVQLQLKQ
ncbi:DUF748 domain-containing protein [Halodesulfovibrio marinisediminis]|uniref:DUF748 domain-containing protein n=1 Tax=Halodesulfovibrio marinisediminis DSM 17456 TaxID=1121457 RepID=A0A1N6E8B6_9BACT|nr:DUF748 domain-containing protein [Halodesulfovibrio marinisediminis]SIN79279.1 protein of unknown function [Halodesulfovibrio marinisediminis DSM 17456]